MNKIDEKMYKADLIKREREQLIQQRGLMKKEIEKQKRDMMDKLEKVKQGKIDPNELLKSISKESPQTIGIINHSSGPSNENSRIASQKPGASVEKSHKKTEPHRKTDEEAKRDMNTLIEKQNAEMLKLLEDEQ
jgi:predicted ATP-grasp superfamily ATP-dependent carboligase